MAGDTIHWNRTVAFLAANRMTLHRSSALATEFIANATTLRTILKITAAATTTNILYQLISAQATLFTLTAVKILTTHHHSSASLVPMM
jgi:hypothetical protein